MTTQEILELETGTKEAEKLTPKKVKIEQVEVVEVGEKGNKKLSCLVQHPDRDEPINVSSVKYEKNGKLQVVGLWVNLDDDKKLRKGSPLVIFKDSLGAEKLKDLVGKEVETTEDDSGYLCFKNY